LGPVCCMPLAWHSQEECMKHAARDTADPLVRSGLSLQCIVGIDGDVRRVWRTQRIQEVLVAKGGRYILVGGCVGSWALTDRRCGGDALVHGC
jgi:hypothetical protein